MLGNFKHAQEVVDVRTLTMGDLSYFAAELMVPRRIYYRNY